MDDSRATTRRRRILDATLGVFVENGYVGTSTGQLAAAAAISKATLYKEFGDKEGVFRALIEDAAERIEDPFAPLVAAMQEVSSAEEGVAMLAEQFTRSVMAAPVQSLRRLVIAEAARFPELGTLYWERGFLRVLTSVASCLRVLDQRELLSVPDAELAAQHLTGMLLWIPSNRIMFHTAGGPPDERALQHVIEEGAAAFVRAHRRPPTTR